MRRRVAEVQEAAAQVAAVGESVAVQEAVEVLPIYAWVRAEEQASARPADSDWPWALVRSREEAQRATPVGNTAR